LSRLNGCTWYWMFGDIWSADDFAKHPSWLGAIDIGLFLI
jgi:hypothetical protein